MTEFFDFVYREKQLSAPTDIAREFLSFDVQSLDAPDVVPAGSTKANASWSGEPFHLSSVIYRAGA